jgi:hypothetical protein
VSVVDVINPLSLIKELKRKTTLTEKKELEYKSVKVYNIVYGPNEYVGEIIVHGDVGAQVVINDAASKANDLKKIVKKYETPIKNYA